ncbi:hypothetical protein C8R42DRAFT_720376 [Lentinula raphanica]|nr:hypothetical protein C8R42DRAFT_720376 [Lentinula raphanica]
MDQGRPAMDRKTLFELAKAHQHLWPGNAGSLNTKTSVSTLERVISDKNGGYRTNLPMPTSTTIVKRRRGGKGTSRRTDLSTGSASMLQPPDSSSASMLQPLSSPSTSMLQPQGSLTANPNASSMSTSILTPHTLMNLEHVGDINIPGEILITVHVIDKRENPAAEIAVDILVDKKFISYEGCVTPQMFKVKASEIVRILEIRNIIRGFIKLSTPHHRIPTAHQPFLISQNHVPLLETLLLVEYLTARESIALTPHQIDNIIDRLKQKREDREQYESQMKNIESFGSAMEASTSTTTTTSDEQVPLHVARVRSNVQKATGALRTTTNDKSKALRWLTEQVVAKEEYTHFNRFRGSDKAQNPDIVRIWLFVSDLATEYLNKTMHIPNITSEIKITKKMLYQSLAIHETTLNTTLRAASLVRKYGQNGSHASMEVVARLTKVVSIDRTNGDMPEGRKKLLEFLENYDLQAAAPNTLG